MSKHAAAIERNRIRRATPEGRERERRWTNERRRKFPIKRMLQEARVRARAKGIPFDLKESDLELPDMCPVLGIPIVYGYGGRSENSASLDRHVPELGYVPGNVAIMSWRANRLKNDATVDELMAIVRYCYDRPRRSMSLAVANQNSSAEESDGARKRAV